MSATRGLELDDENNTLIFKECTPHVVKRLNPVFFQALFELPILSLAWRMDTTTLDATTPATMDTTANPMLDADMEDDGDSAPPAVEMESTTHPITLLVNMTAEMPCSVVADSWKKDSCSLAASLMASKMVKMVPVAITSCSLATPVAATSAAVLPVAMVHSMYP